MKHFLEYMVPIWIIYFLMAGRGHGGIFGRGGAFERLVLRRHLIKKQEVLGGRQGEIVGLERDAEN